MSAPQTTPTISAERLTDLGDRLAAHRSVPSAAATRGVGTDRLDQLVAVWRSDFEWSKVEQWLSETGSAVAATADGRRLHYVHAVPDSATAALVLLLHGWPDSPLQFRRLLPLLVAAGHPVVAPSAAGFAWSEEPAGELSAQLVAADVAALMAALGYDRYLVHGTDWGASVGAALAETHPEEVVGLHLLQPPFDRAFLVDRATASEPEVAYLEHMDRWNEGAAYVGAHLHQADTLAATFADSPAGLLAWLTERYDAWSGSGVDDHDVIAAAAVMWLTDTFRSSVRLYSEPAAAWSGDWSDAPEDGDWASETEAGEGWSADGAGSSEWSARCATPTAFALFPSDIGMPPRDFCERFFDVRRFTVMPRGGHWAALEEPHLLAEDLVEFARSLSPS